MTGALVGTFDVLVVDPPWSYGKPTANRGRSRNAATKYAGGTMGTQAIIETVPMDNIAADSAHLYLWTTNPKLPLAFSVMEAWGFVSKTTLTWVKVRKDGEPIGNGMGWFYRGCTEHVLFGVRGNKPIPSGRRLPNIIHAERGAHSVKPDAFYSLVDAVSAVGDRKIDIFARRPRPGWQVWGDEVAP